MRSIFAAFLVLSCCAAVASAGLVISVGDHSLLSNTPGQMIAISISGGDALAGINLYAQVGDGGPELSDYGLPAGTDGPSITAVNLMPAVGIFTGKGTQTNTPGIPQVAISNFDVTSGTVAGDGVLAELTFDTTGFFTGTWALNLKDVLPFLALGGPYGTAGVATGGGTAQITITNGSITVPEPATVSLLGLALVGIVARHRRKA